MFLILIESKITNQIHEFYNSFANSALLLNAANLFLIEENQNFLLIPLEVFSVPL